MRMDRELLYNASGAKDETAYKAIKKTLREGETMGVTDVRKGEIWEVESGIGTKLVVVINCFEKYAATVMLQEQEPGDNAVQVVAHGIMYADAGRLGYVFYDKMVDYVRTLAADEERELRQAIGTALELEVNKVSAATTAAALEARDKAYEAARLYENIAAEAAVRADEMERRAEAAEAAVANQGTVELVEDYSLREDLAAARKEAEIYKGLYEAMLQRALG